VCERSRSERREERDRMSVKSKSDAVSKSESVSESETVETVETLTEQELIENAINSLASETDMLRSAVVRVALDSLTERERNETLFSRDWNAERTVASYYMFGHEFTLTKTEFGTWKSSKIPVRYYYSDGVEKSEILEEKSDDTSTYPTDQRRALKNVITRFNNHIQLIVESHATDAENAKRSKSETQRINAEQLANAEREKQEALALASERDATIRELQEQLAQALANVAS